MYPIKQVKFNHNYILEISFSDGSVKRFSVGNHTDDYPELRPLLEDEDLFKSGKLLPQGTGIYWNDDIDAPSDALYEDSIIVSKVGVTDPKQILANALIKARKERGITQVELAEKTGIGQPDISKIERAQCNSSLETIAKLAEGLSMSLVIHFKK
ncbi:MAG: helix-turn-helix domain-containing protein [Bacilli bacterium]|nr:helix-turn-helix domain-containing protein [Bacilli bacterium]